VQLHAAPSTMPSSVACVQDQQMTIVFSL